MTGRELQSIVVGVHLEGGAAVKCVALAGSSIVSAAPLTIDAPEDPAACNQPFGKRDLERFHALWVFEAVVFASCSRATYGHVASVGTEYPDGLVTANE
jgi:hypothetical protein